MAANRTKRIVILFLLISTVWAAPAGALSVLRGGPSHANAQAEAIVTLRVTGYDFLTQKAGGNVLSMIRGNIEEGSQIEFVYPDRAVGQTWTEVGPLETGTCLLAFLKERTEDGFWVPVTAGKGKAKLFELGISSSTEEVSRYSGRDGFRNVPCEEVPAVTSLLPQLLQWDEINKGERTEILDRCFKSGSSSMRRMALEWIFIDPRSDFAYTGGRNGFWRQCAEWGALCVSDPDREVRELALVSLSMAAGEGMGVAPYFAAALEDPDWLIRSNAVGFLERAAGHAAGAPVTNASQTVDVRASAWKNWWEETGSKMPEFKADIIPGGAESEHLQPDAPGE